MIHADTDLRRLDLAEQKADVCVYTQIHTYTHNVHTQNTPTFIQEYKDSDLRHLDLAEQKADVCLHTQIHTYTHTHQRTHIKYTHIHTRV